MTPVAEIPSPLWFAKNADKLRAIADEREDIREIVTRKLAAKGYDHPVTSLRAVEMVMFYHGAPR